MRQAVAAVVAVVLVTVGAVVLLAPGGDGDDASPRTTTTLTPEQQAERQAASAWLAEVGVAFEDLGSVVPRLVSATDEWRAGDLDDAALRAQLEGWEPAVLRTRAAVADVDRLELAPAARDLYLLSADLYVEVLRTHLAAIAVEDALEEQIHLLARRVRVLADRIFDRGRALVEPYLHQEPNPDVTVNLPEEVPIWPTLGLAPGPPLANEAPVSGGAPPLREEDRPEQTRDDWLAAMQLANPPPSSEIDAAAARRDAEALQGLAERLTAAAEALREEPDPEGGREEFTRIRLGLLVHAEAARAAQAGSLTEGDAAERLVSISEQLVVAGDHTVLWADDLPVRGRPGE